MTRPRFEVHVCTSCADPDIERRRLEQGGGRDLLDAIRSEIETRSFAGDCTLLDFECLGACQRRGRVSIASQGRWGVVFGGLDDRTDPKPLCDYIGAWLARPFGEIVKAERPACLKNKIIGRVPPPDHHRNCLNTALDRRPNQAISAVSLSLPKSGESE